MTLDFKEIPQANKGDGLQDIFELLSRDILEAMGFKIIEHPDRGAYGKKDLVVTEYREGIIGITEFKWLVSCKHYAHSGKSISDTDEPDINDRLKSHHCDGFMGFYSTLPARSLTTKLKNTPIENEIFDRERIESFLLSNPRGIKISRRFFPKSFGEFSRENPKPVNLFHGQETIKCEYCDKDLLKDKTGMFVFLKNYEKKRDEETSILVEGMYFSCKGICDRHLRSYYYSKFKLSDSGWDDITNLLSPLWWLHNAICFLDRQHPHRVFTFNEEAYSKVKQMFIRTFPHVSRELTTDEQVFSTEEDYINY